MSTLTRQDLREEFDSFAKQAWQVALQQQLAELSASICKDISAQLAEFASSRPQYSARRVFDGGTPPLLEASEDDLSARREKRKTMRKSLMGDSDDDLSMRPMRTHKVAVELDGSEHERSYGVSFARLVRGASGVEDDGRKSAYGRTPGRTRELAGREPKADLARGPSKVSSASRHTKKSTKVCWTRTEKSDESEHSAENIRHGLEQPPSVPRLDKGESASRSCGYSMATMSRSSTGFADVVEVDNSLGDTWANPQEDSNCGESEYRHAITKRRRAKQMAINTIANLDDVARKGVAAFVYSVQFDICAAFLVLANAVTIGMQINDMAERVDDNSTPVHEGIDIFFCAMFSCEIVLRLYVYRLEFFTMPEWRWNVFDAFVVGLQVIEKILSQIASASLPQNVSVLRVLRILRLVRIVRLLRILRLIKDLRILVKSILGSMVPLFWTMMLLLLTIYLCGIFLTQQVLDHRVHAAESGEVDGRLKAYYGTLPLSFLSLYESVTGGVDWHDMLEPLIDEISPAYGVAFSAYIAFALLALMNVVSGYFVQAALENSKHEQHNFILNLVTQLLKETDVDNSGYINWSEFQGCLEKSEMQDYFKEIDVDIMEARTLFNILDYQGKGEIEAGMFISGCLKLQGSAKALDLIMLCRETRRVSQRMGYVESSLEFLCDQIPTLKARLDPQQEVVLLDVVPEEQRLVTPKRSKVAADSGALATTLDFETPTLDSATLESPALESTGFQGMTHESSTLESAGIKGMDREETLLPSALPDDADDEAAIDHKATAASGGGRSSRSAVRTSPRTAETLLPSALPDDDADDEAAIGRTATAASGGRSNTGAVRNTPSGPACFPPPNGDSSSSS